MQILTAAQIRAWDLYTIEQEPITSFDLMERAASQCTKWLIEHELVNRAIKIFCGKGNNGGDGLAIACQLAEIGVVADVYILEFGALGTDDFQQNLTRLHAYPNQISFIQDERFFPELKQDELVIDALYGSGVNRPLQGLSAALVQHINNSNAQIISIDLPSGMFVDGSTLPHPIVRANYTLTFQCLKLCFLLPENEGFFGAVEVLNIDLDPSYLQTIDTPHSLNELDTISNIYKPRRHFAHKGNYGHSLIVAGNIGKMGAAILCTKACLRSGAALVTAAINTPDFPLLQSTVPEAMVTSRSSELSIESYTSIGIGPGLGTGEEAVDIVKRILEKATSPMVLDADALNIIGEQKTFIELIPKQSILTPHPKEFSRLFGSCGNDYERIQLARRKATALGLIIILKGHRTAIGCPSGKMHFNSTGNPGMATAGSGDVLTGILTGLLSQGYEPLNAAQLGVYLHGLAGDIAASKLSQEAMIAGDIIKYLGEAFKQVSNFGGAV
jgi:ADP-dependent NAD(P)H-hydrate dehydratase / NAD(P)H-hydrate epimerase